MSYRQMMQEQLKGRVITKPVVVAPIEIEEKPVETSEEVETPKVAPKAKTTVKAKPKAILRKSPKKIAKIIIRLGFH